MIANMDKTRIYKLFVLTGATIVITKMGYNLYKVSFHKVEIIETVFTYVIYAFIVGFAVFVANANGNLKERRP